MTKPKQKASRHTPNNPPPPSNKPHRSESRKQAQTDRRDWSLIIFAVLAILGTNYFFQHRNQQTDTVPGSTITAAEAYQKYSSGVFLLDVREPEEWDENHIPDTTLIPLSELEDRIAELPKNQEIIVVCRSGNRSQEGRDILLENGFTQVSSMSGGLKDWQSAGYPVTSGP